ncbi:MAG: S8 family serine peptidase, partial [Deltaproteobacteria bacterium]|nr:S8 family serine peptidase [Deltaproteobacteria bacterium]
MFLPRSLMLSVVLIVTATGPAVASLPGTTHRHRVDPAVNLWFAAPGFRAVRSGTSNPGGKTVPVSIRVGSADRMSDLLALDGADISVVRLPSGPCVYGTVASARVTRAGLATLARLAWVRRVDLDVLPPHARPLDVTAPEIYAPQVWRTQDDQHLSVTGKGMTIADLDSGIDVFHPFLFRADGGYFAWIDVNHDGAFQAGIDAVDLNGNGTADATETLQLIDAFAYPTFQTSQPVLDTDNGLFDAGWDFLYVDTNGNQERDFGLDAGFTEQDPAYGEPLFVADDVNGNGVLDVGEKVILLKTSKVAAVWNGGQTYVRGQNLIALGDLTSQMHGTGVAGILVGGEPGITTLVGIAPDADLVMAVQGQAPNSLTEGLTWALQQGADVVLHEYAPWTATHLDGSTNHEHLMDQASANGTVQINPTGNLGGSQKACVFAFDGGDATDLPLLVPRSMQIGYVNLTMHWRDSARDMSFVLHTPSGETVDLGVDGIQTTLQDGQTSVAAYRDDSDRGTAMFDLYVYKWNGNVMAPIEFGTWLLSMRDTTDPTPAGPVEVSGFVSDEMSGWGVGARFTTNVSEEHLIGFPATADSAVSVAAYAGRSDPPFNAYPGRQGQLRSYSCRGTRLDGLSVMDVAGPDNPLSSTSRMDYWGNMTIPYGAFMEFGGTSGASPHVAGTAALVKQVHPDWTGQQVRDAIRAGALVDGDVVSDGITAVEDLWGAGKVRAYEAVYGESPIVDDPPTITIAPVDGYVSENLSVVASVSDKEDAVSDLHLFWDIDYDGQWDVKDAAADQPFETAYPKVGTYFMKVQVRDSAGNRTSAVARIHIAERPVEADGGTNSDGGGTADGGTNP